MRKNKLLYLILSIFFTIECYAQTTAVSAIVVDKDTTTWVGGTWKISFTPSQTFPDPKQYTVNGSPLSNTTLYQNGTLSSTGALAITVYDNSQISPTGSMWNLTVCPNATAGCQTYLFSAVGATLNISSALTGILNGPRFSCINSCYGYSTSEIISSIVPGTNFFNTSTGGCLQWLGTIWGSCSGSIVISKSTATAVTGTVSETVVCPYLTIPANTLSNTADIQYSRVHYHASVLSSGSAGSATFNAGANNTGTGMPTHTVTSSSATAVGRVYQVDIYFNVRGSSSEIADGMIYNTAANGVGSSSYSLAQSAPIYFATSGTLTVGTDTMTCLESSISIQ